ncbi:helix-turn-helix domain-containing protein [Pectobacterium carotovorum subsp. carotovorum]|uniref:helix-turn-helix domain-containing protein n=1 Tax=Pectobacterium carotovorum TaxID=554 RepID=UPI0015DE0AB0|nr:helix-turn-helix domain-containing protein [Pectobacterium carotovorum]MBA0181334.1 helix-turn-helix domain-containing protein [Pectobacterium carotovorum]MBB1527045.1 helix-turn-helix domain-containing protein [Pectobacterium carotovorum subsp. carotovorum]MCA6965564.1 helix-turn-helix domain-containing protein [Pectobacterium carotovorum]MCH4987986.1 helix-turn-helix domain-containing protein [Pectobacterium carotovorum]WDF99382.1 helix-turn-helix domain-containing protein [Pectobacterium
MKITSAGMLAHAMRDERKKHKLNQSQVAESMGIKQSTVSDFENHPEGTRLETLFKLLAALDLELHLSKRGEQQAGQEWSEEW